MTAMHETPAEVENTFGAAGVGVSWVEPGGAPHRGLLPLRLFMVGGPSPTAHFDYAWASRQ